MDSPLFIKYLKPDFQSIWGVIMCYVLTTQSPLIEKSKYTENGQDDSSEFVKYITLFFNLFYKTMKLDVLKNT